MMDRDEILKALAHPTRNGDPDLAEGAPGAFLRPEHPLDMGRLRRAVRKIGLSQSTVSSHLAVLQRAGPGDDPRVGQWVFYRQ